MLAMLASRSEDCCARWKPADGTVPMQICLVLTPLRPTYAHTLSAQKHAAVLSPPCMQGAPTAMMDARSGCTLACEGNTACTMWSCTLRSRME